MQATNQSCEPAVVIKLFCRAGRLSVGIEKYWLDVGLAVEKDETPWQPYQKIFRHPSAEITKLTQVCTPAAQHYQVRSRYWGWKNYPLFPGWFEFRSAKWRNITARKCRAEVTCTNGRRSSYGSY